jgi:predicted phosphate transport protein (TIGR00153 family)
MINLFPKDEIFYTLFEKQADKLTEAVCLLDEILKNPQNLKDLSLKMKKLETEADSLGHEVVFNLERSFITPLEGEDIDLLRQKLDDIMDHIEKAVNRMFLYQIPRPFPEEIEEYAKIIKESIKEINLGVKEIRNVRKFQDELHERCQKLNELEDKGDVINRRALEKLMNVPQTSPEKNLEIIKLKDVYEYLENTIDYCEDVGNIFESILIKNR